MPIKRKFHNLSMLSVSAPLLSQVMAGVILLSTLMYFHGFRGRLPYHLDPDEPVFYISAAEIRLTGRPQIKPTYSPLRFYEMALEEIIADALGNGRATTTVYGIFARANSAFFALLLLASVHRIGRELHSPLAGVFAALLLAFDTLVITFSHLARGDTLGWVLSSGVVLGALGVIRQPAPRWWLFTLICAACAVLAKYSMAPILFLPGYLILTRVIRRPLLRWGLVALAAVTGLSIVAYLRAHADVWYEPLHFAGLQFLLSPAFPFMTNIQRSLANLWSNAGGGWLAIGLSSLPLILLGARARFSKEQMTLLALLYGVVIVTLTLYSFTAFRYGDSFPGIIIWAILGGVALGVLAENGRWVGLVVAILLTVWVVFPKWVNAWNYSEEQTRPHTLEMLGDWFIAQAPQGTRTIVEKATPFNVYAGFPGRPIYHQFVVTSIFGESIESYRERGYEYLIWNSISDEEPLSVLESPEKKAYLADTTEVLRLTGADYRGPDIVVFQLKPLQQHIRYLWFNDSISFRGYDLSAETFQPGDQLTLMLYWMSAQKVSANDIVFVHLVSVPTRQLLIGQDGPPDYGNTPTWSWRGDMQFIRDQHVLIIPAGASPGKYSLQIGMYDADTKARLPVFDLQNQPLGDTVTLQELQIEK